MNTKKDAKDLCRRLEQLTINIDRLSDALSALSLEAQNIWLELDRLQAEQPTESGSTPAQSAESPDKAERKKSA